MIILKSLTCNIQKLIHCIHISKNQVVYDLLTIDFFYARAYVHIIHMGNFKKSNKLHCYVNLLCCHKKKMLRETYH